MFVLTQYPKRYDRSSHCEPFHAEQNCFLTPKRYDFLYGIILGTLPLSYMCKILAVVNARVDEISEQTSKVQL